MFGTPLWLANIARDELDTAKKVSKLNYGLQHRDATGDRSLSEHRLSVLSNSARLRKGCLTPETKNV